MSREENLGRLAEHVNNLFAKNSQAELVIVPGLSKSSSEVLIRAIGARYPRVYNVHLTVEVGEDKNVYSLDVRRRTD